MPSKSETLMRLIAPEYSSGKNATLHRQNEGGITRIRQNEALKKLHEAYCYRYFKEV